MFSRQIDTILALDNAAKPLYRGTFPMDRLPTERVNGIYIINTDDHDQPGGHWVAVFVTDERVEYFDSYGLPPLDSRCERFLGTNYWFNTYQLQQLYSNACGFYCVYFVLQRARGQEANTILNILSKSDSGFIVKNYLYSRYKSVFN